jgi:hypothetical protein
MDHGPTRCGRRGRVLPRVEALERRRPLTATAPGLVMVSATTVDSRSVTIQYDVTASAGAAAVQPLEFGVYRSALDRFDASAVAVGSEAIAPGSGAPTLDAGGRPAAAPGPHQLTIPLAGGLPPDPEQPYVLVVANPSAALASGDSGATASFRTHVIAVVTHGGLQDKSEKHGPVWEQVMAAALRREGFDVVIPFNWVDESGSPGAAPRQSGRLARDVLAAANRFPASQPVDLFFIGHSEGTVVNDQAIRRLETKMSLPPELEAGYLAVTMLDPHAANPDVPGQQYSVASGPLGWLAKSVIDNYQGRAHDPRVTVPPGADRVEVFYEHTPARQAHGSNDDIYNLWGQVPVRGGPAYYFNLTPTGATHSGKTGVVVWYERNVVPLLGDGAPQLQARILTGALEGAAGPFTHSHRATYSGAALPGSAVRLFGGPASRPWVLFPIGRTKSGSGGEWSLTTRPLADGRYRILAQAVAPRRTAGPRLPMVPTAPLGLLVVAAHPG